MKTRIQIDRHVAITIAGGQYGDAGQVRLLLETPTMLSQAVMSPDVALLVSSEILRAVEAAAAQVATS